ncbi:Fc.00g116020.m01.CDS01 [Cosmosporella sp. VM-42]
MAMFSPLPAYILGTACFGRGLMAVFSPENEYTHVGLPLESRANPSATHGLGSAGALGLASPLMYFKGLREISYGLLLVTLQRQGNQDAVTTFAAILSLVRFGDGLVVWLHGGESVRSRALGHWITGAGFVGWAIWRRYS